MPREPLARRSGNIRPDRHRIPNIALSSKIGGKGALRPDPVLSSAVPDRKCSVTVMLAMSDFIDLFCGMCNYGRDLHARMVRVRRFPGNGTARLTVI